MAYTTPRNSEHTEVLESQLSRRMLLKRAAILGLSVPTAATLLAACAEDQEGEDDSEDTEDTDADSDAAASDDETDETDEDPEEEESDDDSGAEDGDEPRSGGILTKRLSSDPPNFDMHQNSTFNVLHAIAPCYSTLTRYQWDAPFELEADLAEDWETSDDGLEVNFHLREGVTFHHGKELDAEDVKASYDRIIDPPEGVSSPRSATFFQVEEVQADDLTVTFVLSQPSGSIFDNVAQGWMSIFPKDILDEEGDMTREVSGTGPFMLSEYVEGVSVELERNPDYFIEGKPYLDGITLLIIPDDGAQDSAFMGGDLSIIRSSTRSSADRAEQQFGDDVTIQEQMTTSCYTLEMNSNREPWGEIPVRRACSLAIDRDAAVDVLTEGAGEPTGMLHPEGRWALSLDELREIPGYSEDKETEREQARELLAEAGYEDGIQAHMLVRQGEIYERPAVFFQDQLAQIGIEVELDVQETATFYESQDAREFDLFGGSASIAIDDPDAAFGQAWICGAGRNYSEMCHDEVDAMFEEQSQMLDFDERLEVVHELQRVALDEALKVVLGFRVNWALIAPNVRNYQQNYSIYITETHRDTWLTED